MTHARVLFAVLLIVFLTSCPQAPMWSNINITVWTKSTGATATQCTGGMKIKFVLLGRILLDEQIPYQEEYWAAYVPDIEDPNRKDLVKAGNPLLVEAWCYATDSTEIGYVKVQGKLKYHKNTNSIVITGSHNSPLCIISQEKRGKAPCVDSLIIQSDE